MQQHWKILLWMLGGILTGILLQFFLEAPASSGLVLENNGDHARIVEASSIARKAGLGTGTQVWAVRYEKDDKETRAPLTRQEDLDAVVRGQSIGEVLYVEMGSNPEAARKQPKPLMLMMSADAARKPWIDFFGFLADIFMALLKMLIVPLVLTSIITGVAGVGAASDLRRLGFKTLSYYVVTSLLAIVVGLLVINIIRPGDGAALGLPYAAEFGGTESQSFFGLIKRMIPTNLFQALVNNSSMLQVIFFAILFGICITVAKEPHRSRMKDFFESAFEIMMRMAELILKLIPYGVFCLLAKNVGATGIALFQDLGVYMLAVIAALLIHGMITLPILLKTFARISPVAWWRAMAPAIMTAFSTSSSSMTLPVTMESVEKRGGISNRTSSFVLPLGATINMDGTALYECVGVIFLAQYYAGVGADPLGLGQQILIVFMALMASIGTAAIPSAGLVMMLIILSALHLPLEGAALLLAIDRPLDMLRTTINVWSDSCGCAIIGRSEGEDLQHLESASFHPE